MDGHGGCAAAAASAAGDVAAGDVAAAATIAKTAAGDVRPGKQSASRSQNKVNEPPNAPTEAIADHGEVWKGATDAGGGDAGGRRRLLSVGSIG